MLPWKSCLFTAATLTIVGTLAVPSAVADDAPQVSTFAPAEDLAQQVERYLKELDKAVADEEAYKDSAEKIARDANTLIVVALALGLHDQPSKYKAPAGAIMTAAKAAAAAQSFAAAQTAVAAVHKAAAGQADSTAALQWEKVAALPELMKQVPLISTKLKMNIKGAKFQKKARDTAGYTAALAVIAQGTLYDASAAKTPEQAKQWRGFSAAARDAAAAVNAAIHAGDEPAAAQAMEKLNQSCEACHAVFKPDVK